MSIPVLPAAPILDAPETATCLHCGLGYDHDPESLHSIGDQWQHLTCAEHAAYLAERLGEHEQRMADLRRAWDGEPHPARAHGPSETADCTRCGHRVGDHPRLMLSHLGGIPLPVPLPVVPTAYVLAFVAGFPLLVGFLR